MKADIALRPCHITETTRFTVEADYELTEALHRYQAYYREAYGHAVTEADLLRAMARQFIADDKDFQGFGRKQRRSTRRRSTAGKGDGVPGDKLAFEQATK
ncbi:MAG: DUF2274 domain-containing protein [Phycisphaerae bacterium]|jgi:hypothetical protein